MRAPLPLRLRPGADLRAALEAVVRERGWPAAFVVAGIGSLVDAQLRLADQREACRVAGCDRKCDFQTCG